MKKIIILFLVSLISTSIFAQDPAFSQAYANPLYLNPAYVGTGTNQRIGLNYRYEWPNIPGSFVTYNVSYDRNIIDSSNGIGFLAIRDNAANMLITNNISVIYAHQFHVKSFTLSMGFQGTYHEKIVDLSNLTYGDMIDATRGFVYNSHESAQRTDIVVPDFSAGIMGYGKQYFFGFAMDHLTQPDEAFVTGASPLPIKYVFNAGGMIPIGGFTLSPTVLYQSQQDFKMTVLECYLIRSNFTAGLGYRFGDAMIFTLGYQNKWMRLGYSYDYTTSVLTNEVTGGSHEVSLAVLLHYKLPKFTKVNGINCPNF